MKIFEFCDFIFDEKTTKRATGLSRMAFDISNLLASNHEVYAFHNHFVKKQFVLKNVCFLKHSIFKTVFYFNPLLFLKSFRSIHFVRNGFKFFFKKILYCLNMCYISHYIKKLKIDCVHIHGAGVTCFLISNFCKKNNIPIVLTLHGIINKPEIKINNCLKEIEKKICILINDFDNGIITTVSSGTKSFLKTHYFLQNNKIAIIYNPCYIASIPKNIQLPKILKGKKYAVCVGSITNIRNQISLIEAFNNISSLLSEFSLVLVGRNLNVIDETKYKNNKNIIFLGQTDKLTTLLIEKNALFSINPSYCEGFGLPILESFYFHKPVLISKYMDSFNDFYDSRIAQPLIDLSIKGIENSLLNFFSYDFKNFDDKAFDDMLLKFSHTKILLDYEKVFFDVSK